MKRLILISLLVAAPLVLALTLIPQGHAARENSPVSTAHLRRVNVSGDDDQVRINAAGQPNVLNAQSALSAALFTAVDGANAPFDEVSLIADWDGREDFVADRAQKIDDFSFLTQPGQFISRTGISEHTFANGFLENVYHYGDSIGNYWVGTDLNPTINPTSVGSIDTLRQINIPTLINTNLAGGFMLLNPQAGDCSSPQILVTGVAVNPVADLGDFGLCDTIGEVVYVSVLDTAGCPAGVTRTRILAFAFTDVAGGLSPVGAIQILRNQFSNAGITLDDNGSLYFHLVDLINTANGAAIFKVTEGPRTVAGCAANPRVNRTISSIPNGLNGAITLNTGQGTGAFPILTSAGFRLTNFSGPSTTFGNVVSLAAGPANVIYAAVSRSFVAGDDPVTQSTEGQFTNPAALGATPSMIISFADRVGLFDRCSAPDAANPGAIPVADGLSDVAQNGLTRVAGVNNFRVFALGNGPDIRPMSPATSPIVTSDTLKLDMQIDFSGYSGLTVDEAGSVFAISGGTPAGVGLNPSPTRGEILAFPDAVPADRRADPIDFRGNGLPNPPASGGNVGDGDSDRFDHVYLVAPIDPAILTPGGLSGLSRGFLRYTNRLAPTAFYGGNLGTTVLTLGDDTTEGPINFEAFDPGHQVAGGDDQNTPFRGDDNDGAGNPVLVAALEGGFEFAFGGPVGVSSCVWNSFFLNSNGSITFGAGQVDFTPSVIEFRQREPMIAPAWTDLNPGSRNSNKGTFPLQALGFAAVNKFKVRFIDVPAFSDIPCTAEAGVASNTFAVILSDDGVSNDENENQVLDPADPTGDNIDPAYDEQEGPTDLRFLREPNTNAIVGENPRRSGSGNFVFEYGRMDLLGSAAFPVITGYSIGGLSPTNPPGVCETNLGVAATSADNVEFGVIQGQTATIEPSLIGEGTEPGIYEFFGNGQDGSIGGGGQINLADVDFDLRFEGNDPVLSKSVRQTDFDKFNTGFFGISCGPPANPLVQTVIFGPFVTTPTTTGVINAIGPVQVNLLGSGFFPNEVTTICPDGGPAPPGDVPTLRPGKTVSTALTLSIDTNGDGIPEAVVALSQVTPLNRNLVRATLTPLATFPGTAFPLAAGGGIGIFTATTTFTAGDNNIFGPFTRTAVATAATGNRAPVVLGVTASGGDCSIPQDVLISGSSFVNVTEVFAVEQGTNNIVDATSFFVLTPNLIQARFNFPPGSAGKTFLIFVTNNAGTSRNLLVLPPGSPPVPLGNEQGNLITFTCGAAVPPIISFGASSYSATEGTAAVTVTAQRSDSAGALTVNYVTSDDTAIQRADYTMASGSLTFAPGEASKTFEVLINDDSYSESTEVLNILMSTNSSGNVPATAASAVLNIIDNDNPAPSRNVIDDVDTFVRQQYHDFLNREPDAGGLAYWGDQIRACGTDAACVNSRRVGVSAAFFAEREFQDTGFYIYLVQKAVTGLKPDYDAFMLDRAAVADGSQLDANKTAYAITTLAAPEFSYLNTMSAAQFVDTLNANSGNSLTQAERDALVNALNVGGLTRASVLREVAENANFRQREYNNAFVLMQYFGYLRRNPDPGGYDFWVDVLNNRVPGNFRSMVCGFITSAEYQDRFGAARSHSNSECAAIGP